MKKLWLVMLLSSIVTIMFKDPSTAITAMIDGSHAAVRLSMSLVALYAFWLGFFAILEKTGIAAKLAKLLTPLVRFLFPKAAADTNKFITMNISANLLGLGNAATPMAINAVNSMKSEDDGRASINMIMLMVISSTSLQLLPTTVIGLRASHGAANPADFLLPCMAATITSTILGITLVKIYSLFRSRRKKHAIPNNSPATQVVGTPVLNKSLAAAPATVTTQTTQGVGTLVPNKSLIAPAKTTAVTLAISPASKAFCATAPSLQTKRRNGQ